MKKFYLLTLTLGLILGSAAQAQQIPLYSNYFFTPFIYNPAQSGSNGVTEATMIHRRQWAGIEGGPETSAITLNGALNREKVGYSVYAFSDRTDIVQRIGVYGSYAYHVKLSDKNTLSFGLSAGYLDNNIDVDRIRVPDEFDPLLFPNLRRGNFDMDFGINLTISQFQVGASVLQLIGAPISYSDNYSGPVEYGLIRHFVFNAQYDLEIQGDKRVLSPMVMVRTAPNVPTQIDVGAIFNMKDYGYVGAMYRSDYAITANLGVHLTEQLTVGYAYDFSTNTYGSSLGTSHEFMLTYRFGSNRENERMQDDIRRIKDRQRADAERNEEYVRERLEEFKEELEAEQDGQIDEAIQQKLDGMTLQAPGRPSDSGNPQGGNPQQQGGEQRPMNGFDPNTGQPINSGQQPVNSGQQGGTSGQPNGGYDPSTYASNVQPGSPGYYITAGVFGSESNARRLMQRLQSQGMDVNIFQDRLNNMYYVYLMQFRNYNDASQARDSKLNGTYDGRLWIKIVE